MGVADVKRWSYLFIVLLVLTSFCSGAANDQTGKFSIGGQAGFSVGFGSAFCEQEFSHTYWDDYTSTAWVKNELRHEWGVKVKYGLKPSWALAGIYEYQAAKPSVGATKGVFWEGSVLESFRCLAINLVYIRFPERKTPSYYTGGVGWYMIEEGKDKPGINAGMGAEDFLLNYLGLDVGLGLHMIFTEPRIVTYINLHVGLNCYF